LPKAARLRNGRGAAAEAKRDLQATAGGPRATAAKRRVWGPRG